MSERRRELRMFCADPVDVFWNGRLDRAQSGYVEDISRTGICVVVPNPISMHSWLKLRFADCEVSGSVCRCERTEHGFKIGIKLDPSCYGSMLWGLSNHVSGGG